MKKILLILIVMVSCAESGKLPRSSSDELPCDISGFDQVFNDVCGSRSTIYGWIEDGLFTAKKHDLPFAGTRRKPHKKPETKTNAQCRVGRTYADLLEWLKANPDVVPTEADTVIGSISGKVLFTFMVRNKLPLAFLRDAKTSQTFTRIINMLWDAASVTGWLVTYGATNRPLAKIWSMNIRKVNVGAS